MALETQFEEILEESNEVDETEEIKRIEEHKKVVKQSHFIMSKQASAKNLPMFKFLKPLVINPKSIAFCKDNLEPDTKGHTMSNKPLVQ